MKALFTLLFLLVPLESCFGEVFLSLERPVSSLFPSASGFEYFSIPVSPEGAAGALKNSASFEVRKSGGGLSAELPSLRGFYSRQTAVFIEGVRLPKDITGTNDLSILPVSFFDEVELVKGGLSPVYGADAEGGALAFSLKEPRPGFRNLSLYSSAGSFGERLISVKSGFAGEKFSLVNSAAWLRADGFQENSSYDKKEISAFATRNLSPSLKMHFSGFAVGAQRGLPGGTPFDISLWNGEREKKANTPLDSQDDSLLWGSMGLEKTLDNGSIFARFSASSLSTKASQYNVFSLAMDKTNLRIVSDNLEGGWRKDGFEMAVETGRRRLFSSFYGDREISSAGIRTSFKSDLGRGFYISPFLRMDENKKYSDQISPGLAFVWEKSYEWKFSARAVRSWQAPSFADLYNPWAPNEKLRPESSRQVDFSIERRGSEGTRSWLSIYYSDIKDRIALDPARNWAAYNIDSAFNSGLEGGFSAAKGPFGISSSLSAGRAMGKSSKEGTYKLLPYISPVKGVSSFTFTEKGFSAILSGHFSSARWSGRGRSGLKMPQYSVYDIYLSLKKGPAFFNAGCYNLFDRRYALNADSFNGYYPADPRTFRLGAGFSFI